MAEDPCHCLAAHRDRAQHGKTAGRPSSALARRGSVPLLGRPPGPGTTWQDRRAAKQCVSPHPMQPPASRTWLCIRPPLATTRPTDRSYLRVVSLCEPRVTWPPLGSWPCDSRLPNAMPHKQLRRSGGVTWPPGHSAAGKPCQRPRRPPRGASRMRPKRPRCCHQERKRCQDPLFARNPAVSNPVFLKKSGFLCGETCSRLGLPIKPLLVCVCGTPTGQIRGAKLLPPGARLAS
jgi:hypothetical protein